MILINNEYYKICLVDSNIISDVLKKSQNIHKNFLLKLHDNYIFSFSPLTLVEMRKKDDLLNKFKAFFKYIPIFFLKSSYHIYKIEESCFPKKPQPEMIIDFIVNQNHNNNAMDLATYLNSVEFDELSNILVTKQIELFKNNSIAEQSIAIKKFKLNANEYIELLITKRHKEYGKYYNFQVVDESFSSLKIQYLLQYYNYHVKNKKIRKSDQFDLLISASTPYVDVFMTENSQSSTLKIIKEKHNLLNNLEILTMKDLRE